MEPTATGNNTGPNKGCLPQALRLHGALRSTVRMGETYYLIAFDKANLDWPAQRNMFDGALDHLDMRPYEVAYFAHMKFPYERAEDGSPDPVEWLDVNESLTRLIGPKMQNPWRRQLGTMTCMAKFIFRYFQEGRVHVRQLAGIEAMHIIGFDTSMMPGASDYMPGDASLMKMAGNAFSGFAAGPCLLSLVMSMRHFKADEEPPVDVSDSEMSGGAT